MRRTLFVSMALVAAVNAPAVAQTCLGLASFSSGNMQVSGNGQFTEGVNRFGAGFTYGIPAGVFAGAQLSTTSYDGADASSMGIGANVGYQLTLGKSANIHVCPVASFELGMGPDDDATNTDASSQNANLGFSLGTTLRGTPRMQIIPTRGPGSGIQQAEGGRCHHELRAVRHLRTGAAGRWPGVQPEHRGSPQRLHPARAGWQRPDVRRDRGL